MPKKTVFNFHVKKGVRPGGNFFVAQLFDHSCAPNFTKNNETNVPGAKKIADDKLKKNQNQDQQSKSLDVTL